MQNSGGKNFGELVILKVRKTGKCSIPVLLTVVRLWWQM